MLENLHCLISAFTESYSNDTGIKIEIRINVIDYRVQHIYGQFIFDKGAKVNQ